MSQSYQQLIADEQRAKALIEGSYVTADHPVNSWENGRRFIADSITHDGTILDIGCANGFLLKSLQSWSTYSLDPYGIDANTADIQMAQLLFPQEKDHFVVCPFEQFLVQLPVGFPQQFDFIYWAVWVNYDLTPDIVNQLRDRLTDNGRLILGFYPDRADEPSDVKDNLYVLEQSNISFTLVKSPFFPKRNEQLAIIGR